MQIPLRWITVALVISTLSSVSCEEGSLRDSGRDESLSRIQNIAAKPEAPATSSQPLNVNGTVSEETTLAKSKTSKAENATISNTNLVKNVPNAFKTGVDKAKEETKELQEANKSSDSFREDLEERSGKLLAYYTTKTKNLFATTSISVLSTCFSATNTACTGRRKKRSLDRGVDVTGFDMPSSTNLDGTVQEPSEPNYATGNVSGDRDPKKFTIWSTLFSTYTLTSTYYFSGTTVTISGACSIAGMGSSCFG
ncbi:uncharacterized protein LOC108673070 [Hyalella azteca]|uniref:Uncharacterized protein LOC108673070 n=1 Tax=Hyalella azteca TaxID=294128 RepID=A0A8B7NRJ9_HYAAZ|nr:uncharacterized protein LOC108673070 [Hyalella azteca]